jgi:hypothetical protein
LDRDTLVNVFPRRRAWPHSFWRICIPGACSTMTLPVARYWPEFAAHGKERVTVRQLISTRRAFSFRPRNWTATTSTPWRAFSATRFLNGPRGTSACYHAGTIRLLHSRSLRPRRSGASHGRRYLREEIMSSSARSFTSGFRTIFPDSRIANSAFSPMEALLHLAENPAGAEGGAVQSAFAFLAFDGGPGGRYQ